MAKKSRKSDVSEEITDDVILEELEKSTKKDWFGNFKIHNEFKLNEVHNSFVEILLYKDTKMAFVDGPAGSAKSYLAVYAALQLLQKKQINQIIYVRSIVESASKSIGSLPGELDDKFQPWSLPLIQKLDELVGPKVGGELLRHGFIKPVPVNFVRGLTFRDSVVIVDEIQNMTREEIIACITRIGENTKYVLIGDSFQADIGTKSGFTKISQAFNDEESEQKGIYNFTFTESEVVRSQILKFIVKKLERGNNSHNIH